MTRLGLAAALGLVACTPNAASPALDALTARRAANARVLEEAKGARALRNLDRDAISAFLADAGTREPLIEALASSCRARVAAQKPVREAIECSEALAATCSRAECAEPLEQLYESTVQLKEALRALERDTKDPCAADFARNFDAYIERIRAHRRR